MSKASSKPNKDFTLILGQFLSNYVDTEYVFNCHDQINDMPQRHKFECPRMAQFPDEIFDYGSQWLPHPAMQKWVGVLCKTWL